MFEGPSVEEVLHAGFPEVDVDRARLANLLRCRPSAYDIIGLLSSGDVALVRPAIVYLGACGTLNDCPLLALHLHHADDGVAALAEYSLWNIWMRAGSARGNRRLADAIRCIGRGGFAAADRLLGDLIEDEPSFAEAHFQRGVALSFLDRLDEAAAEYRHALHLNSYHFAAAQALGHVLVEQGRLADALHYYRRALQIHPRLEKLAGVVRALERVVEHGAASP